MTGYGRSRRERDGREITLEIKSVNHRFFDLNLRLPRGLLFLEDSVRKALSARLRRGHVDVFLTYRNTREDARVVSIDTALVAACQSALDNLASTTGLADDRSLMALMQLPEVMTISEKEEDQGAVLALMSEALEEALAMLMRMRREEGASLGQDISAKLGQIMAIVDQVGLRAPQVVLLYKEKLEARLAELLAAPPDPARLAQEVAILADRASIDEELVRLKSHLQQLAGALEADEPIGRKLDFLIQECNREINTIGSKASDLEIGSLTVSAKAEIEKIREQIQNIE